MHTLLRSAAALLFVLLMSSACATAGAGGPGSNDAQTTVRVDNRNFLDMTIYVLSGSQRIRLGTAPGLTTRTFPIPGNLVFGVSTLQFQADPVGGSATPISQEITVTPGDEVTLIIPS